MSDFLEELRSIVGRGHVLCDGDLSAWEENWRRRARGKVFAVMRLTRTAQIASVVRPCCVADHSIVPQWAIPGALRARHPMPVGDRWF